MMERVGIHSAIAVIAMRKRFNGVLGRENNTVEMLTANFKQGGC